MKKLHSLVAIAALISTLSSCNSNQKPINVIYLIGDGMGFGAVSSLLLTTDGQTGFEMAPVIGLNETCSANNYVTDSPAGITIVPLKLMPDISTSSAYTVTVAEGLFFNATSALV